MYVFKCITQNQTNVRENKYNYLGSIYFFKCQTECDYFPPHRITVRTSIYLIIQTNAMWAFVVNCNDVKCSHSHWPLPLQPVRCSNILYIQIFILDPHFCCMWTVHMHIISHLHCKLYNIPLLAPILYCSQCQVNAPVWILMDILHVQISVSIW